MSSTINGLAQHISFGSLSADNSGRGRFFLQVPSIGLDAGDKSQLNRRLKSSKSKAPTRFG